MAYIDPVNFSATNRYGCGPEEEDDVYTVAEFMAHVAAGSFIDYDGHGYPVKDGKSDRTIVVQPSTAHTIPKDATHVVWYNR